MVEHAPESESQADAGRGPGSFERLVDEHSPRMYAIASRFCGSPDEAEDLVQEVFTQAFRGWESFRGESSEMTWLYRIAARACQRMHRKRSGEPDRIGSLNELLPFDEPLIAAIPDPDGQGVLSDVVRREAREGVERAITGLPDEFRVPLVLKDIAGFSVKQVAEVLGMEEGTVRSRVHRARLKLRTAVDAAVPRTAEPAPPPAYDEQTCMDLLNAKQEALDRGVPFESAVLCQRCRAVFATLDLTEEVCHQLAEGPLPPGLRERLAERIGRSGG